jgi:hypothetical protein
VTRMVLVGDVAVLFLVLDFDVADFAPGKHPRPVLGARLEL